MSYYSDAVVTNAGDGVLQLYNGGAQLTIDGAVGGTGTVSTSALMAQTALVSQKQSLSIVSYTNVSNGIKLGIRITSYGVTTQYTLNQIGVKAHANNASAVLLALYQDGTGVTIPTYADKPDFAFTFNAIIAMSNTGTLSVTIDTSALVSLSAMNTALAAKQDKITISGVLKGDGTGNITAATAGSDYGLPLATGSGAPSDATAGVAGQHYYDSSSGKEYVCNGVDTSGKYIWALSGASDAADLTYNGGSLDTALDNMAQGISDLGDAVDESKTLSGATDPTSSTAGAVGQMYLNTSTGETFICTAASGSTYTWKQTGATPVYPEIVATVTSGAVVTCTDGTTTLTATSNGSAKFEIPNYGSWTLQATYGGQTSGAEVITVDSVKQYAVTLSFFSATLTVTAEVNAVVAATDGTHNYSGTCGSGGACALTVRYAGTYTITATKNSATSSTASKSVTTSGSSYTSTVTFCTLTVTIDSGSAVSVTNGATTLTGTSTSTGTVKFYLPNTGTWTATATLSGQTASGSISCGSYTGYSLELSYVKVFGVSWNYGSSSTALTRLLKSTDPNSLVTVDVTTEPVPAVGTASGSSPFDSYMPWSGMDEFNVISNALSYQKGATGFSRTSYDTVVRIPKFYYKIEQDTTNSKFRFYVADGPKDGFSVHPAFSRGDGSVRDYIYTGRYNTGSGYITKSGYAPLVNITRATARSGSHGKGTPWWQYDYAAWSAAWLLYLVEFADWNSQTKIGRGYVDGSAAINSGGTDSMTYHTGRASGTDGLTAVQYRHIENPWGNVWEWIDGINFSDRLAYICLNPANFADDTSTNYTSSGVTLCSSGWITGLTRSSAFPFAFLPTANGGSETTYIPDYVYSYAGWYVLVVGGSWYFAGFAGLFYFYADYSSSNTSASIGARLLFLP